MKMFLLGYSAAALCLVLFASGAVSAVEVKKAVGDEVSFSPVSAIPTGASIIWKHRRASGVVTKVIEYDEDGENIPSPTFKVITTLDTKTGKITIKNLTLDLSGDYTIDINSKEQEQKFTLTVKNRVPKPTIKYEKSGDLKAAYLTCKYDESVSKELSVIWKNSTGEMKNLMGNERSQSITVYSTGNPENYYTCTLDNIVSAATSDPVRENDLFKVEPSSGPWWIILLVLLIIGGIVAVFFALYRFIPKFQNFVDDRVPWKKGTATSNADPHTYTAAQTNDVAQNPGEPISNNGNTHPTEGNNEPGV